MAEGAEAIQIDRANQVDRDDPRTLSEMLERAETSKSAPAAASRLLRRRRRLALAACAIAVLPALAVVVFGVWIRSGTYRRSVERRVGETVALPISIERIAPTGIRGRSLRGVRATKPETDEVVLEAGSATWLPAGGRKYRLTLSDGFVLVGSSKWRREDYESLAGTSLGQNFDELDLASIRLERMDLAFRVGGATLRAESAAGLLQFAGGLGTGTVSTNSIGGASLDAPAAIKARFIPRDPVVFQEASITVPKIELRELDIEELLGTAVHRGTFEGTAAYAADVLGPRWSITGALRGGALAEWTGMLPPGPIRASLDIDLKNLEIVHRRVESGSVSGRIGGLHLSDVVPSLAAEGEPAVAEVILSRMQFKDGRLEALDAGAECRSVSLQALTALLGEGEVTGVAELDVKALVIGKTGIERADVRIEAFARDGEPATISREFLQSVAQRALGLRLDTLLPSELPYRRIGARLLVKDNVLTVRGTHGTTGDALVTVEYFNRPIELLRAPARTYDLSGRIDEARAELRTLSPETKRTLLQQLLALLTSERPSITRPQPAPTDDKENQ